MTSLTRMDIKPDSELHEKIITEVRRRVNFSDSKYRDKRSQWRDNDEAMVAYVPADQADIRRDNKRRIDGKPQYTTIRVPYSYGVAMSLHAYMVAIFLTRSPVWQFEGLHGEGEQQVMALEALHNYQYNVGVMGPKLFSWLYDTVKYGVGIIGDYWCRNIRHVAEIIPLLDPVTGKVVSYEQQVQEVSGYVGNELFNCSVFDFLPDPRVPVREFQKGEFCGSRQRLSYQVIKERELLGYYTNIDKIDPRIVPNFPTDNDRDRDSPAIQRPSEDLYNIDTFQSGAMDKRTPEIVPVYEMFINIIPDDWKLGSTSYPCKWVFTVTGDYKTVIGATPFGALHAEYPYSVNEMEFDATALANRGIPEINEGLQNTIDWLLNSHMYNVRASLNNLFVVDPQRVFMKDITDPLPGGVIRRRPGAVMGGDKPVEQLLIQDITRNNVSDMQMMKAIGEQAHGVSDILMGSAPQGGRRTATESRGVMAAGTSRAKVTAEYLSLCGFNMLSGHLVSNSQQYYEGAMKLKIVGSLAQLAGPQFLQVTPDVIAGHFNFVPVDGSLPIDRFAQLNLWKDILMGMEQMPALLQQYDVGKIFAWVAQLGGIRNLNNFRIQTAEQGMLQQQAQQGDIVPLTGGTNPDLLKQVAGNGPVPVGSIYGQAA